MVHVMQQPQPFDGDARLSKLIAEQFGDLPAPAQQLLRDNLHWVALPAGAHLLRAGEAGDAMYLVVSGRLRAYVPSPTGPARLVREMGRGAIVGEISLFTAETRTADVLAVRESLLARLDRDRFEALIALSPQVSVVLARLVVDRLRSEHMAPVSAAPRTLALVSLHASLPAAPFAQSLAQALEPWGRVKLALAPESDDEPAWQIARWEADHDFVLLVGAEGTSDWQRACLQHGDETLLLADASQPLPAAAPARVGEAARVLLLMHPPATQHPRGTADWIDRLAVDAHWHLRAGQTDDLQRIGRLLARQGVGVVLAGGGARGFAHLGVMQALQEAGVPVDAWGGASMGALMGSLAATQAPPDRLLEVARRAFKRNPTGDFNLLPLVSLIKGQRLRQSLRDAVHALCGHDAHLEDLWRPAFCVATNYSSACEAVIHRGDLQRAVRASTAIPGALPPVVRDGELYCDGGGFNNFPVDVMRRQRGIGTVIGVNLFSRKVRTLNFDEVPGPWALLRDRLRPRAQRRYKLPSLVAYLLNNTIISSLGRQNDAQSQTDVLFQPPVDGIGLLHWHRLELARSVGLKHAQEVLAQPNVLARLRPVLPTSTLTASKSQA
jgi:NTE family protein